MKKYLVFFCPRFYPRGGFEDFIGTFDSIEECRDCIQNHPELYMFEYISAHIVDSETLKIIWTDYGDENI